MPRKARSSVSQPLTLITRFAHSHCLVVGLCPEDIKRDVLGCTSMRVSFLYCHTFENCRCRYVEILFANPICSGLLCGRLTSNIIPASFNISSPGLSYKVPAKSATITASPQTNSSKYVFGDCANATNLSPAYTTVTSLVNTCGFVIITAEAQLSDLSSCSVNTTIVSTIAPSTTCCTKCEVGADRLRLVYVKPPCSLINLESQYTVAKLRNSSQPET